MNMLKIARCGILEKRKEQAAGRSKVALLLAVAAIAFSASAITQAEWEADHSLIPSPSASSEFYVSGTEPTGPIGEQTVEARMTGLDATPNVRVYEFPFQTWLRTFFRGLYIIVQ
jgi:hypothetical protein